MVNYLQESVTPVPKIKRQVERPELASNDITHWRESTLTYLVTLYMLEFKPEILSDVSGRECGVCLSVGQASLMMAVTEATADPRFVGRVWRLTACRIAVSGYTRPVLRDAVSG